MGGDLYSWSNLAQQNNLSIETSLPSMENQADIPEPQVPPIERRDL